MSDQTDLIASMLQRIDALEKRILSPLTVSAQEQKNICSLIANCPQTSGVSTAYGGRVAANGTAVSLPAGWTSSRGSAGNYIVTHNLGTTNYGVGALAESQVSAHVPTISSTFVQVLTTDTSGSVSDSAFDFVIVLI